MTAGSPKSVRSDIALQQCFRDNLPQALPAYLQTQRWFAGKAGRIESVEIIDVIPLSNVVPEAAIALIAVRYADKPTERYALTLLGVTAAEERSRVALEKTAFQCGEFLLADALHSTQFLDALRVSFRDISYLPGAAGHAEIRTTRKALNVSAQPAATLSAQLLKSEQSNSSIRYGDQMILKLFRRLSEGTNPELEMGSFLSERAHFKHAPAVLGDITYRGNNGSEFTLAILQEFIPNQVNAWDYTLQQRASFSEMAARHTEASYSVNTPPVPGRPVQDAWFGNYLLDAENLGRITAQMHLALASDHVDPTFAPEGWTKAFQQECERNWSESAGQVFALLARNLTLLPQKLQAEAKALASRQEEVTGFFHSALEGDFGGMIMRIHGDYHLGQVLHGNPDFVIIDFEGEPARPIAERRAKQSPLKDIAGMLRSFDYAARSSSLAPIRELQHLNTTTEEQAALSEAWVARVQHEFVHGYFSQVTQVNFLPRAREEFLKLLKIYLLEKALYELAYELNSRPEWVGIPLGGIKRLLDS